MSASPFIRKTLEVTSRGLFFLILFALFSGGMRIGFVDFRSIGTWSAILLFVIFMGGLVGASPKNLFGEKIWSRLRAVSRKPEAIVCFIFLCIGVAHLARFLTMGVFIEDAGYVYQSLFHPFRPNFLHCDICVASSYMGEHQSYSLALFGIWTALFRSPYFLPILSALLGALAFLTYIRTEKRRLPAEVLSFVVVAVLSIRGFRNGFLFDFREDIVATVFFLGALAFLRARNFTGLLFCSVIAAFSKETAAVVFPVFAISLFFLEDGKRLAFYQRVVLAVLSLAILVFCFRIGMPIWNGDGHSSMLVQRYGHLGSTPAEIFKTMLLHPSEVLRSFGGGWRGFFFDYGKYIVFTVGPFVPFMLLAWNRLYLPAFLVLAGNLLSPAGTQRSMVFHYDLLAIPFFMAGLSTSIETLIAKGKWNLRFATISLLSFLAVSGSWPLSGMQSLIREKSRIEDSFYIREVVRGIPAEEIILADSLTYPHVTDRIALRVFPKGGRAGNTPDDGKYAILRQELFNSQSPEWKSNWKMESCSPSSRICLFTKQDGST